MNKKLKLLLLKENSDDAKNLARDAVEHGFCVTLAFNFDEAINWLEHEAFDVVISDAEVGGVDGSELVHRIHMQFPSLLVTLMAPIFKKPQKALARAA